MGGRTHKIYNIIPCRCYCNIDPPFHTNREQQTVVHLKTVTIKLTSHKLQNTQDCDTQIYQISKNI